MKRLKWKGPGNVAFTDQGLTHAAGPDSVVEVSDMAADLLLKNEGWEEAGEDKPKGKGKAKDKDDEE